MKELLEFIVKNLVTDVDAIKVEESVDKDLTILTVTASDSDLGKLIGKNGKVAQALRAIIRTANRDSAKKYTIKIQSATKEE